MVGLLCLSQVMGRLYPAVTPEHMFIFTCPYMLLRKHEETHFLAT